MYASQYTSELEEVATKIAQQGLDQLKTSLEREFDPLKEAKNIGFFVKGHRETFFFDTKLLGDIKKVIRGEMDAPKDDALFESRA